MVKPSGITSQSERICPGTTDFFGFFVDAHCVPFAPAFRPGKAVEQDLAAGVDVIDDGGDCAVVGAGGGATAWAFRFPTPLNSTDIKTVATAANRGGRSLFEPAEATRCRFLRKCMCLSLC
ncbi:hypothetical protein [Streptomyces sp. NBC_01353]|uniref:hypothetical protein n=1 Tax=Streptomyces sp. NBC_01353 TaxID=2903835 RepID=UPI002E36A577|nr:hypothetical protein [Streptomyces sp. NBC_01353]